MGQASRQLGALAVCLAALLALSCSSGGDDPSYDPFDGGGSTAGQGGSGGHGELELVRRWVKDVVLGPEYGGSGAICSRWQSSPVLSFMAAASDERALGLAVVADLNERLAPAGLAIEVGPDGDSGASLLVYFVPVSEMPTIAAQHGFTYVPGNWGYFWMWWDDQQVIDRAVVLLGSDVLAGDMRVHFAYEEITQSLGLANDSPLFPDSIFYADGAAFGDATALSELDQQLVTFFYTELEPGDVESDVDLAFDTAWPD